MRSAQSHNKAWWIAGLMVALVLAGIVSFYASSSPDGLEKVAADKGMDTQARDHDLAGSPLAGYQTKDVGNVRLSGGLAGVIGVGATLAVGTGVFYLVRRRAGTGTTPGGVATGSVSAAGEPPSGPAAAGAQSSGRR